MSIQGDLFAPPPAPPPVSGRGAAPEAVVAGPRTVTLVDASGFIFRAYHALPPLTTSKGVPTNAVLGFARMLLKLLRERKPSHLALCFDKDSRKGRLAIDPQYKANREAPPADLVTQFELIRKVAEVLALPIVEAPGWEADDVIATLVDRARAEGFEVEIISSDKDLLQLLGDGVRLFDPGKDKAVTEADALERFGVKASQLRDFQALVGDAIDNVPKVPGIGPKTAADLLGQFGSLDALLARLDEVAKPKLREALRAHRAQIDRARQLVTFRRDLPLEVSLDALACRPLRQAEARALFTELEFFRLVQELPAAAASPLRQAARRLTDDDARRAIQADLAGAHLVALAPAFEGEPHSATLQGLALALDGGRCWYLDAAEVDAAVLGPALRRRELAVAAYDGKALLHLLASVGIEGVVVHTDVELQSYLLNPARKEHALAELARERLGTELPAWPEGPRGRARAALADVPVPQLVAWLTAAADAVARLSPELWSELEAVGLAPLARDLELPLVPVLAKMERAGVRVDREALAQVAGQVDGAIGQLLAEVYRHAGREFNVGSPPQLAQVLFEDLKLPVLKKGKTGPSTDHEVLEKLAEEHPLPRAIIEYRNVAKLKSTYLDTLPGLIGADGRIRTTFHQATAATGRLSSTNPNLQNIPIRTELGRQIRRAFVADPGWVLVSADYSQVELRVLAHIAGDEALVAAFAEGADVHARTAAEVFGVPLAEVSGEQRRAAKMVNYGIAYGLSAHGLAARLGLPQQEAQAIIDRYFERFSGIKRYVEETVERARRAGFVESLFGRRRAVPDLASRNRAVAMAAERAAINMPIQGTAADLVKRAMLELDRRLPAEGLRARMLLQVHDELLFEAPEAEAAQVGAVARAAMSGAATLRVPLVVDVGVGRSWADAH